MLLESSGCMCYKQNKNNGFREIAPFPLIHEFGSPGDDFGGLWRSRDTILMISEGIGKSLEFH